MVRLISFLTLASTFAYAGEGHLGHSPGALIWKGLNILAFLGIVYYFGKKPISEAFNKFYNSIVESLVNAEREFMMAREELSKAKEELENAKKKAQEYEKLAIETAETEKKKILQHAQEVSERIKEKAKETIEIELNKAKKELALYGIQKAEEIAKDLLQKEFKKSKVQEKYIEAQLKLLEERKNA
ncbi:ATP synthase F0 subunit B [Aquifex aeolicus]|uniref:ATP synthase subunit b n=1 Tax=Aquifex aeolicus (strain VF5) TaxID=224324 RepID=ATPF_AQUAE|nr:ATP synthase subunit B [Aquifex aeolicus]O67526.1 RecName: Full=ATP synthase subunit b; AltName: Full=ATP synthase F(0) sector subunit b; AltName: Full=ATPase subunit I; AltName: Full=F-type ATPase subunit b; Short=F-ATPase subunit b [Aquifex aeolicus VF5]AAC07478.1 ATP synthase F0 subunit b [Aquifex aeolicus VF5]